MITAGIDCGAKNTKTVILDGKKILAKAMVPTGFEQEKAVEESFGKAIAAARIRKDQVKHIGSTGSGAKSVKSADVLVNDIKAIAAAAKFFFPSSRTAADVGAEAGRAVKVNEQGSAEDFAVNEKCAAGAGAFIEAMARALEIDLKEMGALALTSDKSIPMNAQCAIFAETEVVGLIHANTEKKDISRAIHDAMASRIVSNIRRVGVNPDVVMMGGVAHNIGFVASMNRELGLELFIPPDPEFGAAVGAAVVAAQEG
jgi:benzoyl-CoA reductase subunit D